MKTLWVPEILGLEKQPFADVFQNRCSWTTGNIHGKTSVLSLRPTLLLKRGSNMCFSVNIAKLLRKRFSVVHLHWLLLGLDHFEWQKERYGAEFVEEPEPVLRKQYLKQGFLRKQI